MRQKAVSTECLLFGLVAEEGGVTSRAFRELGVDSERIHKIIQQISEPGQYQGGKIDLDPGAQQVLEFTIEQAHRMGNHYIGTEHLALGLLQSKAGLAMEIFNRLGLSVEQVRAKILEMLTGNPVIPSITGAPFPVVPKSQVSVSSSGMGKFTRHARRALSLSHQEAVRLRKNLIGTEHLLLGLIEEEQCVASRVLRSLGLVPDQVREMVEQISGFGQEKEENIELSPGIQHVLEFAIDEARQMNHHYIGTEHLILGLGRSPEGLAKEVLQKLEVTSERIRAETMRIIAEK